MDDIEGGFQVESPIVGLSPTPERVYFRSAMYRQPHHRELCVTMYNGAVVLLEANRLRGTRLRGPHVPLNRGFESIVFTDVGNTSNPDMVADDATDVIEGADVGAGPHRRVDRDLQRV